MILYLIQFFSLPSFGQESLFTGEILPVFYVRDVRASVKFYNDLGFQFNYFHDYDDNSDVKQWVKNNPPIYAEMQAGTQKFAIHLLLSDTTGYRATGTRHYFEVNDVKTHYERLKEKGIDVGELIEQPWMIMFSVVDPDGHFIYFYTRPEE